VADQKLRVDITAKDRTKQAFSRVQKSLGALKKSLLNIKTLIGAAFAVVAVRALSKFVTSALDAADSIAKTSRAIGITSDRLQELRFAADISGVSMEALDGALLGFSKRVGEARAGTGALVTLLRATDVELLSNVQSASTVDEAFDLITQAANKMGNEMDKSALLAAAFGRTAGTAFKNLVPDIERLSQQARELGIVIDQSLLEKAEETNDKLTVLGKVLSTKFITFVLENANAIDALAEALMKATSAAGKWLSDMGPDETANIESLDRRISKLQNRIQDLNDTMLLGQLAVHGEGFWGTDISVTGGEIERVKKAAEARLAHLEMLKGMAREEAALAKASKVGVGPKHLPYMWVEPHAVDGAVGAVKEYADELRTIPPISYETRMAMEEATREAKAQEGAIRDLSTTIETTLIDSLADLSTGFANWRDVARSALRDVIRSMLQFISVQSGMGGGGGMGGIGNLLFKGLSSILGSSPAIPSGLPLELRQSGGPLGAGRAAIVGEGGPELFIPRASGTVVPNGQFCAGHARSDRAVPFHLRRMAPGRAIISLAFLEVSTGADAATAYAAPFGGETLPFDYVWFTPRVDIRDACERFEEQLKKMRGE
jgi:hypothetical protein